MKLLKYKIYHKNLPNNLLEIIKHYRFAKKRLYLICRYALSFDTDKFTRFFLQKNYNGVPDCPKCYNNNKVYPKQKTPRIFHCNICQNTFSPFAGSIFHNNKLNIITLCTIYYFIYLLQKNNISYTPQLLIDLFEINKKTAYRIIKIINNREYIDYTLYSLVGFLEQIYKYRNTKKKITKGTYFSYKYNYGKINYI